MIGAADEILPELVVSLRDQGRARCHPGSTTLARKSWNHP
jgi:hypothetical protein